MHFHFTKKASTLTCLIIGVFMLTGCSSPLKQEIARLPLMHDAPQPETVSFFLEAGEEITFWSKMDMEYTGNIPLQMIIEVHKDDELQERITFDPRDKNITIGEVRKTFGNKTSWRFTGKNGTLPIIEDGNYTFYASMFASEDPTVMIETADLILKK